MFTIVFKGSVAPVFIVYAVDFIHDAFLIYINEKFKWVSMKEFAPAGDASCQE